jgi:hypothetical protein
MSVVIGRYGKIFSFILNLLTLQGIKIRLLPCSLHSAAME